MTEEITREALKLLKNANWEWSNCEAGAPSIDCKRPYGNSNVAGDVAELLGLDWDGEDEAMEDRLLGHHHETLGALTEILRTLPTTFGGTYEFTKKGFKKVE